MLISGGELKDIKACAAYLDKKYIYIYTFFITINFTIMLLPKVF